MQGREVLRGSISAPVAGAAMSDPEATLRSRMKQRTRKAVASVRRSVTNIPSDRCRLVLLRNRQGCGRERRARLYVANDQAPSDDQRSFRIEQRGRVYLLRRQGGLQFALRCRRREAGSPVAWEDERYFYPVRIISARRIGARERRIHAGQ